MTTAFKDGDLVRARPGIGGMDQSITGRVVGSHNTALSDNPNLCFYIVLLEKKIDGFPWSSVLLPGSVLKKLTVLDVMARNKQLDCPWCGGG